MRDRQPSRLWLYHNFLLNRYRGKAKIQTEVMHKEAYDNPLLTLRFFADLGFSSTFVERFGVVGFAVKGSLFAVFVTGLALENSNTKRPNDRKAAMTSIWTENQTKTYLAKYAILEMTPHEFGHTVNYSVDMVCKTMIMKQPLYKPLDCQNAQQELELLAFDNYSKLQTRARTNDIL